jgi:hypothetical protein
VFAVAPAPTVYDADDVHDPDDATTVYDPGANELRSSVVAVNPFGPDHANVGAGDPFDAVKLIEPSFTFEHDWLVTIDDKLGAVHDDGIEIEQGVPKVRFAFVALKLVTDVDVPTYAVKPDVVTHVNPAD